VDIRVENGVDQRLHSREGLVDAEAVHAVRHESLHERKREGARAVAVFNSVPVGCAPYLPQSPQPNQTSASTPDAA
jgi:hypothetical protein